MSKDLNEDLFEKGTYFKCEICKKVMYKSEKAQHQCWTGEDAAEFEEQPDSVPYFGSDY